MIISVSVVIPISNKVTWGFSLTQLLNTFLGNNKSSSKFRVPDVESIYQEKKNSKIIVF